MFSVSGRGSARLSWRVPVLRVPRLPGALSAAPHSAHCHTQGAKPCKQRKLRSVVSRGLCGADPAGLLPGEAEAGMCW